MLQDQCTPAAAPHAPPASPPATLELLRYHGSVSKICNNGWIF